MCQLSGTRAGRISAICRVRARWIMPEVLQRSGTYICLSRSRTRQVCAGCVAMVSEWVCLVEQRCAGAALLLIILTWMLNALLIKQVMYQRRLKRQPVCTDRTDNAINETPHVGTLPHKHISTVTVTTASTVKPTTQPTTTPTTKPQVAIGLLFICTHGIMRANMPRMLRKN